jgi:transposase
MLEAPDLGNEDGAMPKEQSPGKPTTRRYTPEEKASAVRMVRALGAELGDSACCIHH